MDYAKATKLARAARGISQAELAQLASCSASAISLIESGQRQPSHGMAQKLAEVLGVPFDLYMVMGADTKDECDMPPEDAEYIGRRLLAILTDGVIQP